MKEYIGREIAKLLCIDPKTESEKLDLEIAENKYQVLQVLLGEVLEINK